MVSYYVENRASFNRSISTPLTRAVTLSLDAHSSSLLQCSISSSRRGYTKAIGPLATAVWSQDLILISLPIYCSSLSSLERECRDSEISPHALIRQKLSCYARVPVCGYRFWHSKHSTVNLARGLCIVQPVAQWCKKDCAFCRIASSCRR
jgi:hypothetical protein